MKKASGHQRATTQDKLGLFPRLIGKSRHVIQELETRVEALTQDLTHAHEAVHAANIVKGAFLADMSHEIRSSISHMLGMTKLLLDTSLTPEQHEYAEAVDKSGKTLLTIINNILDFARLEVGKFEVETVAFELPSTVQEVLALFAEQAAAKGIALRHQMQAKVPTWVVGDPGRLRHILTNLVANAVKFTETGEVVVHVTLAEEITHDTVFHFAVTDTGIGILPEVQGRLFHTFSRADDSTVRKFGDTGLGLAICKQLVETMGGSIGIDSVPDQGSTFWFTMHLAERLEETAAEPLIRVLVAEDNMVNQKVAVRMLTKLGCRVDVANNGYEALETLAQASYNLVFMDCQMPGMDGFEATSAIREREALTGNHLPIIALTSHAMPGDRERCLAAGMDDYMNKPVRTGVLQQALNHWLSYRAPGDWSVKASDADAHGDIQATSQGPIDRKRWDELHEVMGESFFVIVDAFMEDSPAHLQALREAAAHDDSKSMLHIARTLQGSSGDIGAIGLADLCQELVQHCHTETAEGDTRALVERLVAEYGQVRAELSKSA